MARPDVIERNKSLKQKLAVSASWNISEIRKARIFGARNKNQYGNKNALGHLVSQEQREKQSAMFKGRFAGSNHWNWKGGISPRVLTSTEYKQWRKNIFERDNYTCRLCGTRGGKLEAHHIKRWKDNHDSRYSIENGITLCKKCHNTTKFKEIFLEWKLVFQLP